MGRFSPTVLPDETRRERPDLEIAQAFDAFREAQASEEERGFTREDRAIADVERTRRRGREDVSDAARRIEFEKFVQEELGGTPVQEQEAGAPPPSRELFRDAKLGLAGRAQEQARGTIAEQPSEIVLLPGQFSGAGFSPSVVRTGGTRTLAGQEFAIDPEQTAEARGRRGATEDFERKVAALIAQGEDPARARAAVEFGTGEKFALPQEEAELDPTKGEFATDEAREAFLEFKRRESIASEAGRAGRDVAERRAGGRDFKGPISQKDALAELDQMYGEFDVSGVLVGSQLSLQERQRLAQRWAAGELEPEDLPPIEGPEEEVEVAERPGFFSRLGRGVKDLFGGGQGEQAQSASVVTPSAVGTTSSDPSVDSLRVQLREFPNVPPETIRTILLEEGFTEEQIAQALKRR